MGAAGAALMRVSGWVVAVGPTGVSQHPFSGIENLPHMRLGATLCAAASIDFQFGFIPDTIEVFPGLLDK